jgi:predicted HTH domain antitoxin
MNTTISVEVPDGILAAVAEMAGERELSRWILETVVIEAIRNGLISRGRGGEILGLSFYEREELYAQRGLLYDISAEELERQQADLERMLKQ